MLRILQITIKINIRWIVAKAFTGRLIARDGYFKFFCREDGLVIDPFGGSGTTGIAALSLNRRCLLIDNNVEYCRVAAARIEKEARPHSGQVQLTAHAAYGELLEAKVPLETTEQIRFFEQPPDTAKKSRRALKK